MGLFTPHKKHANPFRYTPRYYDPEKERREQRRRELHGTSSQQDGEEYTPGQYIRTKRQARFERASASNSRKQSGMPKLVIAAGIVLLITFVYMLYPRIVGAFLTANSTHSETKSQAARDVEEFNPYAPITIVPNDYKEE